MASNDCIFCRIAAGEIPAKLVREDEDTVAFRDIDPKAPLHVLVVPRRHIPSINALEPADEALIGKLFAAARDIAAAEGVSRSGYRMVINAGPDAGQSVEHVHLHVLGGRGLAWPPG
jgi:histidine triad (HIT) family protein